VPAAPLLHLDLKPSRHLVAALALLHGLALAAAWIALGGWGRYLLCVLILASLGATLAQALLRSARQAISMELHEDGRARWRNGAGIWHEARLGRSQFVSAMVAVVEMEAPAGRRKRVLLLSDSVSREDFRRLRAWLRWRGASPRPESEQ
jgi:hypothetical protein